MTKDWKVIKPSGHTGRNISLGPSAPITAQGSNPEGNINLF